MEGKEPYRVLAIHNYYQIPGGEDTVVSNEKRLLEEHGHAAFFYIRRNQEINKFSLIQKASLPFRAVFSLKTYSDIRQLIKKERIDVVHVHNTLSLISPSVYYAAFRCGVPVIQTVHNFRLLCPGATFVKRGAICEECVKKGLLCAVKGRCYRNSLLQTMVSALTLKIHRMAGIYGKIYYICLTDFNRKKLLQLNHRGKQLISPDHIFVKPNFVWAKERILPMSQRKNQFLYVGRLDIIKGIRVLLEAWKTIGNSQLLICGTGQEETWARTFLRQNDIKNVQLLGQVGHEQVMGLLGESRALVMPAQWYEGQPMVILESYSVGTPVVGSRLGNVRDMIIEEVTGCTFTYNSAKELSRVIRMLPNFDTAKIRQYFEENYGNEQNYEKLIKIYTQVIDDVCNDKS